MQALHTLGSLQCVRELQYPQTRRRIFWVQPLAFCQPQSLAMGPRSSLSAVTFFVKPNSGATIHTNLPSSSIPKHHSESVLSNFCLAQLRAQNCSCSIMMTNEDSLSHAACKELTPSSPILRNQTFLSKLRRWLSPSSNSSPHFTRFSVFAVPYVVHDLRCKNEKAN